MPANAPQHLAFGLDRLDAARPRDTVLVITPRRPSEHLLDRIADANKVGAHIMAIDRVEPDLDGLADEALNVPLDAPDPCFDLVQHLVTNAAPAAGNRTREFRGIRARLTEAANHALGHAGGHGLDHPQPHPRRS